MFAAQPDGIELSVLTRLETKSRFSLGIETSMLPALALFLLALPFSGCANTMTPEAANIMVHTQMSTMLDRCKQLGPVSAEASALGTWTWQQVESQATNNLRDTAAKRYASADSVAVINMDRYSMSVVAKGIAYRCFDGQ